jgi:hypothetical protein
MVSRRTASLCSYSATQLRRRQVTMHVPTQEAAASEQLGAGQRVLREACRPDRCRGGRAGVTALTLPRSHAAACSLRNLRMALSGTHSHVRQAAAATCPPPEAGTTKLQQLAGHSFAEGVGVHLALTVQAKSCLKNMLPVSMVAGLQAALRAVRLPEA